MTSLFSRLFQNATPETDSAAFERLNALSPRLADGLAVGGTLNPEEKTIICRETIVNRQERVVGHEFMLKKNITERVHIGHAMRRLYDQALLSQLIGLPLLQLLGQRFALVHLAAEHIFDEKLALLAGQHTIFILRFAEDAVSAALIQQIKKLRKKGLMFGILVHECLNMGMAELAADIDMAVLDLNEAAIFSSDIASTIQAQAQWPLLACHIDSYEAFEAMWESTLYANRVMFFQGSFISSRDRWGVNPTPALQSQVAQILQLIAQDAATPVVADALKADPVLLYKLLRMAKSSIAEPLGSAEQALLSVGREPLQRWLRLMAHSEVDQRARDDGLLSAALLRGRLMQNLAAQRPDAEQLFLTGVLSLIGGMLQQSIGDALKALNLPASIMAALQTHSGAYFPYLQLAIAVEMQDFHGMSQGCKALNLSAMSIKQSQQDAQQWAANLTKNTSVHQPADRYPF